MFWIMQSVLPRQASARPFVRPAEARWPSSAARSACEGLLPRGGRLDSKNRSGPERGRCLLAAQGTSPAGWSLADGRRRRGGPERGVVLGCALTPRRSECRVSAG